MEGIDPQIIREWGNYHTSLGWYPLDLKYNKGCEANRVGRSENLSNRGKKQSQLEISVLFCEYGGAKWEQRRNRDSQFVVVDHIGSATVGGRSYPVNETMELGL